MLVREIMTESPACCTADTIIEEVARLMVKNDCGCIPVVEDQKTLKPIGVITDRDIVCRALAEGRNPLEMNASDLMTREVQTVKPNTTIEDCCKLMEEKQIRRVAVVDDNGRCCGMVAQADIAINANDQKTAEVVQKVSKQSASGRAG
ncbi:MAG: CBS domain-containing protein [Pyrinomonadaceae bacterium]